MALSEKNLDTPVIEHAAALSDGMAVEEDKLQTHPQHHILPFVESFPTPLEDVVVEVFFGAKWGLTYLMNTKTQFKWVNVGL